MARRARTPQVARAADLAADGPTVLLLRGFTDDRRTFSVSDTRKGRRGVKRWLGIMFPDRDADFLSAERYLGPAVTELVGPLAGLGNPADYLPPEGTMGRYYAPDPDWQDEIERPRGAGARRAGGGEHGHDVPGVGAAAHPRRVGPDPDLPRPAARRFGLRSGEAPAVDGGPGPRIVDGGVADARRRPPRARLPSPAGRSGPGTMLGFDDAGRAQVLISGATTAREYATALAARLAG
jgi:hypothetical protein